MSDDYDVWIDEDDVIHYPEDEDDELEMHEKWIIERNVEYREKFAEKFASLPKDCLIFRWELDGEHPEGLLVELPNELAIEASLRKGTGERLFYILLYHMDDELAGPLAMHESADVAVIEKLAFEWAAKNRALTNEQAVAIADEWAAIHPDGFLY